MGKEQNVPYILIVNVTEMNAGQKRINWINCEKTQKNLFRVHLDPLFNEFMSLHE